MAVEGTTTINNNVLARIAVMAAQGIEGVISVGTPSVTRSIAETIGAARRGTAGVEVQAGETETAFDFTLVLAWGVSIPDIARQVREKVGQQVQQIAGVQVKRVNIHIADMQEPQRQPQPQPQQRGTVQEQGRVVLPSA